MRFILLLAVFISLYIGMLWNTGVIDYNEAAYAEVSREMFVNHEYILPTLNNEGFFEKPPLLYWSQMLGYRLFDGVTAFGARLFNAIAGIATILLLFLAGRKPLGADTAFKGAIILGTSLLFVSLSRIAMTSMLLTFSFTLCLCLFWWGFERVINDKTGAVLFWLGCACAGIAVLAGGLIGALFPLIAIFFYLLSIRRLRLFLNRSWIIPGLIILLVVPLSWVLFLGFSHSHTFASLKDLFLSYPIEQFKYPMNGHSGPLYFYLIVLLIGFLPWSGFFPLAAIRGKYLDSSNPHVRFLRLWLIFSLVTFVFFSLSATKLPDAICPALPGIALLTATLFSEEEKTKKIFWTISTSAAALLVLALGIIALASPEIIDHLAKWLGASALKAPVLAQPIHLGFIPYLAGLILVAAALLLFAVNRTTSTTSVFAAATVASVAVAVVCFFIVLPAYDKMMDRPLARLAEQARAKTPESGRIVMLNIRNRPSVNFYSQRKTVDAVITNIDAMKGEFQDPKVRTGISTEYYLDKLNAAGVPVTTLDTDHGYVLFGLKADHH